MYLFFFRILFLSFVLAMCQAKEENAMNPKNGSIKLSGTDADQSGNIVPFNCDFMGQQAPGEIPVKFAPDIISTKKDDSCFEISYSGTEMVFNRDGKIYITSRSQSGEWTMPSPICDGGESSFSKDGKIIYFNSRAPVPNAKVPLNVWYIEKQNGQWTEPAYLTGHILDQTLHAPSLNTAGDIYSSGITRLKYRDGIYQKAEKLTPPIKGSHPFISSDNSFMIFDRRPPGGGYATDLYISFKNDDATWSEPTWLNSKINTDKAETNAYVTPDGKYMFFTRNFDIYWVAADFIEEIRQMVLK